jgi:hypothetical protein
MPLECLRNHLSQDVWGKFGELFWFGRSHIEREITRTRPKT